MHGMTYIYILFANCHIAFSFSDNCLWCHVDTLPKENVREYDIIKNDIHNIAVD